MPNFEKKSYYNLSSCSIRLYTIGIQFYQSSSQIAPFFSNFLCSVAAPADLHVTAAVSWRMSAIPYVGPTWEGRMASSILVCFTTCTLNSISLRKTKFGCLRCCT